MEHVRIASAHGTTIGLQYLSQVTSFITLLMSTRYSGKPSRPGAAMLLIRDAGRSQVSQFGTWQLA